MCRSREGFADVSIWCADSGTKFSPECRSDPTAERDLSDPELSDTSGGRIDAPKPSVGDLRRPFEPFWASCWPPTSLPERDALRGWSDDDDAAHDEIVTSCSCCGLRWSSIASGSTGCCSTLDLPARRTVDSWMLLNLAGHLRCLMMI